MPSVADYIIRLSVDGTKASVGLAMVSRQIDGIAASVRGFAAWYIGFSGLTQLIQRAERIKDMSEVFGLSTDAVQEFEYAVNRVGGSLEQVAKSLHNLRKSQVEALQHPSGTDAMNFAALGIGASDLQSSTPDRLFLRVADAIKKANGEARALVPAIALMGNKSSEVVAAMANGFADAANEARNLGLIMQNEAVAGLDAMAKSAHELGLSIASGIADPINKVLLLLGKLWLVWKTIAYGIGDAADWGASKIGLETKENADRWYLKHQAEMARDYARFFMDPGVELDPAKRRPVGEVESREAVKAEKVKAANYRRNDVDSLAKVGTYIGVAQYSAPMLDVLRNQLRAQLEIARNTRNRSGAATSEW